MKVKSFSCNEELVRAVRDRNSRPDYWIGDRVSTAAFKDPKGMSVTRTDGQSLEDTVEWMKKHFVGTMVSFSVLLCKEIKAVVKHIPSHNNPRHSEVHGSNKDVLLSDFQLKEIANKCKIHE